MFEGRDLQIKKSFEYSLCNLFWGILQSFKPKYQILNELWYFIVFLYSGIDIDNACKKKIKIDAKKCAPFEELITYCTHSL